MKAYLYCTKSKPYLVENGTGQEHYDTANKLINLKALNGYVCLECEIRNVEEIRYNCLTDCFTTETLGESHLSDRSCVNIYRLESYHPRYAIYLEKVKPTKPTPITSFYYDPLDEGERYLKKAPQNMCYVTVSDGGEDDGETAVLISIQPEYMRDIANGIKDIEVRRNILTSLKEMIKKD